MRRVGWVGVCVGLLGAAAGCGQSGAGNSPANAGSGGASTGGAAAVGGFGVGASGGSGGGSTAHECKILDLKPGDVGAHGVRLLHDAGVTGEGQGLGFYGGDFYYRAGDVFADSHLYKTSVATGGEVDLGVVAVDFAIVVGDSLLEFKGQNGPGDYTITPLNNLSQPKTIAPMAPDPRDMVADATNLYFAAQDPPDIWKVPLAGGAPTKLVPNATTDGIVLQGTSLYWLDFNSEHLMRVPVAGGSPESLVEIFFGGPMVSDESAVYWVDTSQYTVNKWALGGSSVVQLDHGKDDFDQPARLAVDGNDVYWLSSFGCGALTRVGKDGTGSQLVVDGFDDPAYIGVTASHLYVSDRSRVFVIDR